eukprot:3697704-Pyramimonas_sp.AAC.1
METRRHCRGAPGPSCSSWCSHHAHPPPGAGYPSSLVTPLERVVGESPRAEQRGSLRGHPGHYGIPAFSSFFCSVRSVRARHRGRAQVWMLRAMMWTLRATMWM